MGADMTAPLLLQIVNRFSFRSFRALTNRNVMNATTSIDIDTKRIKKTHNAKQTKCVTHSLKKNGNKSRTCIWNFLLTLPTRQQTYTVTHCVNHLLEKTLDKTSLEHAHAALAHTSKLKYRKQNRNIPIVSSLDCINLVCTFDADTDTQFEFFCFLFFVFFQSTHSHQRDWTLERKRRRKKYCLSFYKRKQSVYTQCSVCRPVCCLFFVERTNCCVLLFTLCALLSHYCTHGSVSTLGICLPVNPQSILEYFDCALSRCE